MSELEVHRATRAAWNRGYKLFVDGVADWDAFLAADLWLQGILSHIRHLDSHARLLEAGCGTAGTSLLLQKRFSVDIVGLDYSPNALRCAKKMFRGRNQRSDFVLGDMRHLPFKSNVFKYSYSGGSIEHSPDTLTVLTELRRVSSQFYGTVPIISLSIVGWLRLGNVPHIPIIKSLVTKLHILLRHRWQRHGLEYSYFPCELKKLCRLAGFPSFRWEPYNAPYLKGRLPRNRLLVPLAFFFAS